MHEIETQRYSSERLPARQLEEPLDNAPASTLTGENDPCDRVSPVVPSESKPKRVSQLTRWIIWILKRQSTDENGNDDADREDPKRNVPKLKTQSFSFSAGVNSI